MTDRILGPTGGKRRRRFLLGPLFVVALVALFLTTGAQAVHDLGVFELDADTPGASPAVTDNTSPGLPDDWDRVCNLATGGGLAGCGTTANANTSSAKVAFDTDPPGTSIYTGGGSKDPIDIPSWRSKDGSVPDKDDLLHAFAARYSVPATTCPGVTGTTCELLYFGADRFDNSGDSQIGFWFFRSTVSLNPDGTFSGVHTAGTVPHSSATPGDILILSDFTQGGTQPTVRVFEWVGSGGRA